MGDTWLDTLDSWSEYVSEAMYGPPPDEVLRRAGASIRSAINKLERERKKTTSQEQVLLSGVRTSSTSARSFADLKPALLAVANARRSAVRIDKLVLKMRRLQQQLIETEESFDQLEDEEEDEGTADEMLAQIAAEVNLKLSFDLPTPAKAKMRVEEAGNEADMDELMLRLANLTGGTHRRGPGAPPQEPPAPEALVRK